MPIDEVLLERHSRFRDDRHSIEEQFLQPRLGPGRTVAVLSRPVGPLRPVGWVICHSFGLEQIKLHRLEVVAARHLAAAGFPVLRFFVQGYGDSERRAQAVEFAWHLDGAIDAVSLVADMGGIEGVGLLGVRFGAIVAALAAERTDAAMLGLWQPFATGSEFLRDFAQTALFERMLDQDVEGTTPAAAGPPVGFREGFRSEGWKDLNGFRLSRRALDDISAIDLSRDLRTFHGSALVVGVSRSGAPPRAAAEVAAHIRSIGARCVDASVKDDAAPMLGQHQFKKIGDGEVERDLFHAAYRSIAKTTTEWALANQGGSAPIGDGDHE
jgi:pimeloyl-ACP methyl ester carboxylesterase